MTPTDEVFHFDTVQFFGRELSEYVDMFNLDLPAYKGKRILDCPGGPSTFAMEADAMGIHVVACDPMYSQSADSLIGTIEKQLVAIKEQCTRLEALFDPDKPQLNPVARMQLYKTFAQDYAKASNRERYIHASLPSLPFADNSFDLSITGNLLFMYSDVSEGGILQNSIFDCEFHLKSINELLRVAKEARFYPLRGVHSELSFFPELIEALRAQGLRTTIEDVPYRDLKDAHQMLKVSRPF